MFCAVVVILAFGCSTNSTPDAFLRAAIKALDNEDYKQSFTAFLAPADLIVNTKKTPPDDLITTVREKNAERPVESLRAAQNLSPRPERRREGSRLQPGFGL